MQQDDRIQVWCALGLLALVVAITLLGLRMSLARTLYPGQWAQVDPAERQWFHSQKSPKSGIACCDEADGTYAEEELRGEHYWVRFTWWFPLNGVHQPMQTDWIAVPDAVVIHNANRHGAPTVWWRWDSGTDIFSAKVEIRCYAPGAGL